MRRLRFLVRKEFQELRRNPRMFPVIFLAPVLQVIILGYAATTDVQNVPIVVADGDRTAASRDLIGQFSGSPYFRVVNVVTTVNEVAHDLETRDAWMALAIPPSYGRMVTDGTPVTLQLVADGTDSNSINIALGYASNLIAEKASDIVAKQRRRVGPSIGALEARVRVWFNPLLSSRNFMVFPGSLRCC
jgi:ABC-2 type transport system permease protein